MKTVYLDRHFRHLSIETVRPGDVYLDSVWGECRRLDARRLCLAAERAGKDSAAVLGLLGAIDDASYDGVYDGRDVADWYGLVGLAPPVKAPPRLAAVDCPGCGRRLYALEEGGKLFDDGYCSHCTPRWDPVAGKMAG